MSVISDKEKEEIVIVLNIVKQYPHISVGNKRTILNSLLHEQVGNTFARYDEQVSRQATIVAKKSDLIEIAVQKEYRDFWVGVLDKLGTEFERICKNVSEYRELREWDEKLRIVSD